MVEYYELREVNGEQILVLYLSYDYEFASFDNTSLLSKINNFIKNNNLKWTGNKVVLVVGGLILGSVVLGRIDVPPYKYDDNFHYVGEIILNHYDNDNNEVGYSKIVAVEPLEVKDEKKIETFMNENYINNKLNSEQDISINVLRSDGNILTLGLEDYVLGVVASYVPATFDIEALKAQAVASRTYALRYLQNNNYLTDDVRTQIYKDRSQLLKIWDDDYPSYYNKIKKAVDDTKGVVITYNNELIQSLYYPISNGYTESSYEVFGYDYPYLIVLDSTWDLNNNNYLSEKYISFDDLSHKLNTDFNRMTAMEILDKDLSGRITSLRINNNYYTGVEFRNLLDLKSTDFTIEKVSDGIIITTKGYGHGVGMSQCGANEMARRGKTYREILEHYYPGTTLKIAKKSKENLS